MNNINQILKIRWLTIVLLSGLLISIITIILQNKEILNFKYAISYLEVNVSDMENEKEELETELENCKSERDDFENNSSNQSYDNSSIQNDNSDLEYKIRNLESELDDYERKLRDCN